MENFNVVATWEKRPILGIGWGHPFDEVMKLPDISHAFPDYLYHPHNSVLGMLAYGGVVGFSGLWTWVSISVFLAVRAYHRAHEPHARAGGLVALSVIVAYINQCFGDMGTISWLGTILVAMAATCSGKLATVTNAWPAPRLARNEVSEPEKSASPVGNLV
jgi:O-antigen ligase